jgi:subtilisin
MRRALIILLPIALTVSVGLSAQAAPATVERYIVVLRANAGSPGAVAREHGRAYGAQVSHVYQSAIRGYAAAVPSNRIDDVRDDPAVLFVSPDRAVRATAQTVPTGVNRINADFKDNNGAGVDVAVIDTGIDLDHPDLVANIVGGKNCSTGKSFDDGNGHGTHVAGTIAAIDNSNGVVGVAPEANLWAIRVLNNRGSGSWSSVICGVDFVDARSPANGGPIDIANMSLGGVGSDDGNCGNTNIDALHKAICRTVANGVTFAVAAGNDGEDLAGHVPAAYNEVITVSALADSNGSACGGGSATGYGADDTFATFSNYGVTTSDRSHLVAGPGVSIYSSYRGGGYRSLSGTSMATPHVAGWAALYLAANPGKTPADVLAAAQTGEPGGVSFGTDGCTGFSHTDPSGKHPEVLVRADTL